MSEQIFVLDGPAQLPRKSDEAVFSTVGSTRAVRKAFTRHRRNALWVARQASSLSRLVGLHGSPREDRRLLILAPVEASRLTLLRALLRIVITPDDVRLLDRDELLAVLQASNRRDLLIGGTVDLEGEAVVLYRGSLEPLVVPTSWFRQGQHLVEPDFSDFEVTDSGQTVRLGDYEASVEAILYEHDVDYRRRMKKRAAKEDRSFGGALRRLRIQKGVGRDDFGEVSAKAIARIERGEVARPHRRTVERIAKRLGVEPGEIGTY